MYDLLKTLINSETLKLFVSGFYFSFISHARASEIKQFYSSFISVLLHMYEPLSIKPRWQSGKKKIIVRTVRAVMCTLLYSDVTMNEWMNL